MYIYDLIDYSNEAFGSTHSFTPSMLLAPYNFAISENKILVCTNSFPFSAEYFERISIEKIQKHI